MDDPRRAALVNLDVVESAERALQRFQPSAEPFAVIEVLELFGSVTKLFIEKGSLCPRRALIVSGAQSACGGVRSRACQVARPPRDVSDAAGGGTQSRSRTD